MKDITVIIPLHKYEESDMPLLKRAIESVDRDKYNINISTTKEVADKLAKQTDIDLININVHYECYEGTDTPRVENDFASLVNFSVNSLVGTKWFSILEYDDVYTDIWFTNVEKYIQHYPEISIFLPLEDLIDDTDKRFIGYGNEAPWASSFSNEIGYIDNDCLQQFFDFYMTGAVFNVDDWKAVGGLKPSIKLTFWYEFLLRTTNNSKKVFVIPKVGYVHNVNRVDSLFDIYRKTMTQAESTWWFDLAKRECFFKQDRNKTYENNQQEEEEA